MLSERDHFENSLFGKTADVDTQALSTGFASSGLHKSLDGDQIRLLKLLPGPPADPVCCEIQNVVLVKCPAYEALSYVWGDSNQLRTITLQEHEFIITSNLFEALRRLRLLTKTRLLWVDAICIDQTSTSEKNRQIRLIQGIYRRAECVLIFLGESNLQFGIHGFCLVPQVLEAMQRAKRKKMRLKPEKLDSRDLGAEDFGQETIHLHFHNLEMVGLPSPLPFPYPYEAFGEILDRPWFQRIWVLQEIAFSKSVIVVCGEQQVPWDDFVSAITVCKAFSLMPILTNPITTLWPQLVASLRRDIARGRQLTLLELLITFRHCRATDPRDKIYALCGLVAPETPNVIPDYRLTLLELYRTVAAIMLQAKDGLDLLHVPQSRRSLTLQSLPSWCPDWSSGYVFCEPLLNLRRVESATTRYKFEASNQTLPFIAIDESLTTLTLKGMLVDEIATVAEPLHENWLSQPFQTESISGDNVPFSETELLHRVQWQMQQQAEANLKEQRLFAEWEKMADFNSPFSYPTNESHADVYRKTLTGNHAPNGEDAQREEFQNWLKDQNTDSYVDDRHPPRLQETVIRAIKAASRLAGKRHSSKFPINTLLATGRRLARTKKGYLALVPETAGPGNGIWLVKGSKTPLILRQPVVKGPKSGDVYQTLIGAAYVHGIMYGEAFDEEGCGLVKLR